MKQMTLSTFDCQIGGGLSVRNGSFSRSAADVAAQLRLTLHDDLAEIEQDWREFESSAEGTAFQSFDWVSAWYRHIGMRENVIPAVVIGRHRGRVLFLLPLALQPSLVRRVVWLGTSLNSCNAPLLARDFSDNVSATQFLQLWRRVTQLLREHLHHDLIDLEKIPETVGGQINPLLALPVVHHANDTYVARLTGRWDEFYAAKRSSSSRKTDGKRRRRLGQLGAVQFATADNPGDIERTIEALIEQKKDLYDSIGVANMFERPGYRDFFLNLASDPKCRDLVHVSSFTVGSAIAAASFGLTFHQNYDYVLAGYSRGQLDAFSPGTIHLQELMRHFLERGFKTFDFNIGDAPYKREWCDLELKLYDYMAAGSLRGRPIAFVIRAGRALKRFIKRNPSIWPSVRKARALIGSMRRAIIVSKK